MKLSSVIFFFIFSFSLVFAGSGPIVSFAIGNKYAFKGSILDIGSGQPSYISASYSEEIVSDTTINGHHYFTFRTHNKQWSPYYPNGNDTIFYRRADSTSVYRYSNTSQAEDTIVVLSGGKDSVLFEGKYYSAVKGQRTFASLLYLHNYWIYGLFEGQMFLKSARINNITYGDTSLLSVNRSEIISPQWILYQNYPNPFNPQTYIEFYVSEPSYASITVYDMLGREVILLRDGYVAVGNHKLKLDGSILSSGIYFYTMRIGESSQTKKLMLLR